jgi:PAS domain S-box-containing protein
VVQPRADLENAAVRAVAGDAAVGPAPLDAPSGHAEPGSPEAAQLEISTDFRSLAEAMPLIVWITRKDGWNIYVNHHWVDYTGLTVEETHGHGWYIPVHPDDLQRARDAWLRATGTGAIYSVECRLRRADGAYRRCLIRGVPSFDARREITQWFGTCTDIDDAKRTEAALQRSEDQYRAILQTATSGFWLADVQGRLLEVNESYCRMSGYSARELLTMRIADLEIAESAEATAAHLQQIVASGVGCFESRHRRKDGTVFDVEVTSQYRPLDGGRLVAFLRDITDLKKSESELKLFRTLLDHSNDGIEVLDPDTLRFIDVNDRACRSLGYTRGELLSMSVFDIDPGVHPSDMVWIDDRLRSTGSITFDTIHRRKDGSTFPVEVSISRTTLDRPYQIVVARDITERKRIEEASRQAQELALQADSLLQKTFDAIPDLLTVHDRDLRVILSNWHGRGHVAPEERDSKPHCYACYMRREQPCDPCPTLQVFRTGAAARAVVANPFTGRILEVNAYPVTDASGAVGLVTEHVRDVTESRRDREALQQSEALYRSLVNHLPQHIFLKDRESTYLSCNTNYARDLGGAPEDVVGKDDFAFHPQNLAAVYRAEDLFVMESGRPKHMDEENLVDGRRRWLHTIKVPYRDDQGRVVGVLGISDDITEHKHAEEEHARLEAQLQQAQKMESVGRLAGGVAHDFNNMLGVILGHAELALEQVDVGHPLHADLTDIRQAAIRSANLTRQLLAFARKQIVAPKVLSLNDTVAGMLTLLHRLIGEHVDLQWRPGADLWPVRMDPSQIDQILANLSVNARDAISTAGTLTIETSNTTLDDSDCAINPGSVPGDYVALIVRDNGRGMDKDTLSHLFEPFFTTKAMGEGTGLGLATVYGAVKQNGGYINVYSQPGHGTTFTIYLPRYVGKAVQQATDGAAHVGIGGQETILLVEDEPRLLILVRKMLEREGYSVLAAGTPGDATRLAEKYRGDIHLLITDVVLPEMNGRVLAKNLLALYPRLKRLFMSGYTADVIAYNGVLDDGVDFIPKPFSAQDLAIKVRKALDAED